MPSILAKRVLKRAAGIASVVLHPMTPAAPASSACILTYHRVNPSPFFDPWLDDWNVTPPVFERHVAMLADSAEVVFVRELPQRLASGRGSDKPLVALTFDDGYRSFYQEALPILRRYHVKATMFLVTAYVGSTTPMPFDRWGTRHQGRADNGTWLPLGWEDIEACVRSGLVEFGGHSHRHVNAAVSGPEAVREEAQRSREILRLRLGDAHAQCYAYPYGSRRLGQVTPEYVEAVQRSGYALAVSTNLGLASAASPPYELPRVEVDCSDGPAVLKAKVAGSLAPYSLTERLRRARRN